MRKVRIMTISQKVAVLTAIEVRMDDIRRKLGKDDDPLFGTFNQILRRELEDLEGAYAAISVIKTNG